MLYAFDSSRNCVVFAYPNICKRTKKMSVKKFGKEQGNFSGLEEFTGGETDELDE